jgi:thiol-disulfide isomerase/thioredoxin
MGRLEKLVNVAIVVLCIAVVGDIVRRNISSSAGSSLATTPKSDRPVYKAGEIFEPVANFRPAPGKTSLVLVVRDGCAFCAASMPFYQRIAARLHDAPSAAKSIEFVSVCPGSEGECNAYVKSHGLLVDRVVGIQKNAMADMKVTGTPTLILVDAAGKVESVWTGQLSQKRESEVMDAIGKRIAH